MEIVKDLSADNIFGSNAKLLQKYILENYDFNEWGIHVKYYHTFAVAKACYLLAEKLGLDKDLAYNIGLLHDYARFEQWKLFKSFVDYKTIDHGDEAVVLLFEQNEIKQFDIPKSDYNIIALAIKLHNKAIIDKDYIIKEMERTNEQKYTFDEILEYCKLIRDCDKMDIFNQIGRGEIDVNFTDDGYSEVVYQAMKNHTFAHTKEIKTKLDRLFALVGFLYDMNFTESLKMLDLDAFFVGIDQHYAKLLNEQDKATLNLVIKTYVKPYIEEKIKSA